MTRLGQPRTSPPAGNRRWPRTTLLPLVGIAVGVLCGWATLSLTRPSDGELQRAVLDELGLPEELESAPVIGPVLDEYTARVSRRVVQESRGSATLAFVVSVTAAAAVSTIPHVAWRRRARTPTPSRDAAQPTSQVTMVSATELGDGRVDTGRGDLAAMSAESAER